MKGLNVLAAFLGGAAVGAALGILFAPEKGEDTRHKIAEILRKKGIKLNRNEMDNLVRIDGEVNHTFFHVNYDINTYYPWHGGSVLSAFCSCLYIGAFSGRSDVEFRHHCRHQCCSHRPGYYFPQAAHHFSDGELPR